jgi:hypothetical protein
MSIRPRTIVCEVDSRWPALMRERIASRKLTSGVLLILCSVGLVLSSASAAQSPSANGETFTLSGTVVNSVTGEPIARAMVRTNGVVQRTAFSDSEGHFQIDGLPAVQVTLTAQKPGYSAQRNGPGAATAWIAIGANTGAQVVKLVPQSAIYGRVTDASGQALEHVPVRLTARSVRDGRKLWEQRGMTETDEDGHFRFANLMQGTYYVAAGPLVAEQLLAAGEKSKTGFAHVYYPGAAELASALPIQLSGGQQTEADFSLNAVPVYEVSGSISGHLADQGVGFQLLTSSGDELSLPTTFNMETGTFKLEGLPAGSYIVRAISQAEGQPMRADRLVNVAANVEDLRLALAPSVSIPIVVRMDSRSSNVSTSIRLHDRPPISVRLLPADANTPESSSTVQRGSSAMVLQNVDPGTYTAELIPQVPWYVQSATYGQSNLLYDDIVVAGGQSYPMEIVLRDDSASLSGTIKRSDANQPPATVVVVPQPAGKMPPHVVRGAGNDFSVSGLAPGEYLVFAFDSIDGMEFSNPDAFGPYASQAAHITLTGNQRGQVSLDLIQTGKGD